jgi:uncharacterized protein with beta-barrel porin domain
MMVGDAEPARAKPARRRAACGAKSASRALLQGAALAAFFVGTPAGAQVIDTTGSWNGSTFISSWGVPNTATYGQTITATAAQGRLFDFTFYLAQQSGTPPQYQAFVYQWDAASSRITGPALYSSAVMTAPGGTSYAPVTFNAGGVQLTPGQQYVLMLTTSSVTPNPNATYRWGALTNNTIYAGGHFVFFNNTANFSRLSTAAWSSIFDDLAFIARLTPVPLTSLLPPGAPVNPTQVASAIDRTTQAGNIPPAGFLPLYALTPAQLVATLGQMSGENNTATQDVALQASSLFLTTMLDPMAGARGAAAGAASPSLIQMADLANGRPRPVSVDQGWSVWTKAFAQSGRVNGDANLGSTAVNTGLFGVTAGADKRIGADALVGFALAGGGTTLGLNSRGNGTGTMFQLGLYGSKRFGEGYVSGALAYGWNSFDMTRTVSAGAASETFASSVIAQTYGGRLETGWRFGASGLGVTPYAALEAIGYSAPAYGETMAVGAGTLGLSFAARSTSSLRTELGARFDAKAALAPGSEVIAFGRLAWAYQATTDRTLQASFQSLTNSGFTVFGARPSTNTALATIGAEVRLAGGVRVSTSIDGELGDRHRSIRANAGLRYSW